jgi:starch phosphorylase
VIAASPRLGDVIDAIESGVFSPGEPGRFAPLMQGLRHHDYYMVAADFDAYYATQRELEKLWLSSFDWTRMSILNIARTAWFSSDRTVREYAEDVWKVPVTQATEPAQRS